MTTSAKLIFVTTLLTLSPALAATVRGLYTGTIIDWPAGQTGEVRLELTVGDDFAHGPIDANGTFSLMLPEARGVPDLVKQKNVGQSTLASLAGLFLPESNYDFNCHGEGAATPNSAHFQWFTLNTYVGGNLLGQIDLTGSAQRFQPAGTISSRFLFLDTPAVLNGTVRCPDIVHWFQGPFPAGWNLPVVEATNPVSGGTASATIRSGNLTAQLPWRLYAEYGGIGLKLDPPADGQHGAPVSTVGPGGPAEAAGLLPGDVVVEVAGRTVIGLPLPEVFDLVRGPAGAPVTLGVVRGGNSEIRRFTITRAMIRTTR